MHPTRRLDLEDPACRSFTAQVLEVRSGAATPLLALDRSAFYPEGGGQPADRGTLAGLPVVDVQVDAAGVVLHAVEGPPPPVGTEVRGEVDGERRRDHMQQHSGQHLLSAALQALFAAPTVSFHLGAEVCTVDVPRPALDDAEVAALEEEVARIVREDRPVSAAVGPATGVAGAPADHRVITIADYDRTPCGGTHVARTGEIEAVVVTGCERLKSDRSRVAFLCGSRARRHHRRSIGLLRELCRSFSAEPEALPEAARKTLARLAASEKRARDLRRELRPARVARLAADAAAAGTCRLATWLAADEEPDEAFALVTAAAEVAGLVVVALLPGVRPRLMVGCGAGAPPARALLQDLLARFTPPGRGGGGDRAAQGSWPGALDAAAAAERLAAVAARARDVLEDGGGRRDSIR